MVLVAGLMVVVAWVRSVVEDSVVEDLEDKAEWEVVSEVLVAVEDCKRVQVAKMASAAAKAP